MAFDYFAFPACEHVHCTTGTHTACQNGGNPRVSPEGIVNDDDEDFETVSGFDSLAGCGE